ncbi:MAG: hypothetical protein DPW09_19715 [Anaerolineae bacterium]|nr:hypothetical protein [Anaerolineae bacterium]
MNTIFTGTDFSNGILVWQIQMKGIKQLQDLNKPKHVASCVFRLCYTRHNTQDEHRIIIFFGNA